MAVVSYSLLGAFCMVDRRHGTRQTDKRVLGKLRELFKAKLASIPPTPLWMTKNIRHETI